MADQRISDLNALAAASIDRAADYLPIVDTSANETKKILVTDLFSSGTIYLATVSVTGNLSFSASESFVPSTGTIRYNATTMHNFYVGASQRLALNSSGAHTLVGSFDISAGLTVASTIAANGTTAITFSGAQEFIARYTGQLDLNANTLLNFKIAGTQRFALSSSGSHTMAGDLAITGALSTTGNLTVGGSYINFGNTSLSKNANTIYINAGTAGTINLRPNGDGSGVGQLSLTSTDATFSGNYFYLGTGTGTLGAWSQVFDSANDRLYMGFDGNQGGSIQIYANGTANGSTHIFWPSGSFTVGGTLDVGSCLSMPNTGAMYFKNATGTDRVFGYYSASNMWYTMHNGTQYAMIVDASNGVEFTGNATIASQTFISADHLVGYANYDGDATFYINYNGYNVSTTRFRNTKIGNGKGEIIADFTGDGKAVTLGGSLSVASNLTVNGVLGLNTTTDRTAIIKGVSGAEYAYLEFKDSANTSLGYVGKGSGGSADIHIFASSGGDVIIYGQGALALTLSSTYSTFAGDVSASNVTVSAVEGKGYQFWGGNTSFMLSMGVTAGVYQYGPVQDYAIKTQMDSTAGRGFTWGVVGQKPTAGLAAATGEFQTAGTITGASSTAAGFIASGYDPIGGANPANGMIELGINGNNVKSRIFNDGSGAVQNDLYIDNMYDNAGCRIVMRLRAAGTPVNALILDGSGNAAFSAKVTGLTFQGTTAAISAAAIDWATGTTFTKTLSANTTFTFSNATDGQTINVLVTNTASNYTVTWPTVTWRGGSAPTQTTGAKSDIYTFIKIGSTIYGAASQNY